MVTGGTNGTDAGPPAPSGNAVGNEKVSSGGNSCSGDKSPGFPSSEAGNVLFTGPGASAGAGAGGGAGGGGDGVVVVGGTGSC